MGTYHIPAIPDSARNGTGMIEYYAVNPLIDTTQLKIWYAMNVDGTRVPGAVRYMEPDTVTCGG